MIRIASCASNREKRAKFDLIPTELWTIQKGLLGKRTFWLGLMLPMLCYTGLA
jgi:hypothetical protein